jgi:hypothetical protein
LGQDDQGNLNVLTGNGISVVNDTLTADLNTLAGNGLTENNGTIEVDINGVANEVTTVADADQLFVYDADGNFVGKITRKNFIESAPITDIDIDGGDIATGVVINKSPVVNFNSGDVQGQLTLTQLASGTGGLTIQQNAVTTDKIATDAVTASEIASNAVASDEIASDAVGSQEIQTNAVTSDEIATNAVGSDEIATDAVGADEIAPFAVGNQELAFNAVTSDRIVDGTVGTVDIAANSITTGLIANDQVSGEDINPNLAGQGLTQDGSGNLDLNPDNSTLELNADQLRVRNLGITNDQIAFGTIYPEQKLSNVNPNNLQVYTNRVMIIDQSSEVDWFSLGSNAVLATTPSGDIINKPLTDFATNDLSSGSIFVGNASNQAVGLFAADPGKLLIGQGSSTLSSVALTGDVLISNPSTGLTEIQDQAIDGADLDLVGNNFTVPGDGQFILNNTLGLQVANPTSLLNTLTVAGASTLQSTLQVTGNLDANGGLDVNGGSLTTADGVTTTLGNGQVIANGNINAANGLDITGGTFTTSNGITTTLGNAQTTIVGNVDAQGGLDISGAPLTVANNTDLNGNLEVDGSTISLDATSPSNFTVNGNSLTLSTTSGGNVIANAAANVDIDGGNGVTINSTANDVEITGANNLALTATGGNVNVNGANTQVQSGTFQLASGTTVNEIVDAANIDLANPSDDALATEAAIAEAIADQAGSGLTYDAPNNEIDLGGALTSNADVATTASFDLTVSGVGDLNVTTANTNINSAGINIGDANGDAIDLTGATNINGGNLTIASPQTDINGTTLNISVLRQK